jgi:hypothetical protein
MQLKEFLPLTIFKRGREAVQGARQGVQNVRDKVQNNQQQQSQVPRQGLMERLRNSTRHKSYYELRIEAATKRKQEAQARYWRMRGK